MSSGDTAGLEEKLSYEWCPDCENSATGHSSSALQENQGEMKARDGWAGDGVRSGQVGRGWRLATHTWSPTYTSAPRAPAWTGPGSHTAPAASPRPLDSERLPHPTPAVRKCTRLPAQLWQGQL